MRKASIILVVFALVVTSLLPVFASDSVEVTATVTLEEVSISFWPGTFTTVDYGTLPFGAADQPPKSDPAIKVWNSGTVQEDFGIRGASATVAGGSTWALAGTSGQDQYVHKFCAGSACSPGDFSPLTNDAVSNKITGGGGIGPGDNTDFMLRLSMPTSVSVPSGDQYSTTVTVVATAH